MKKKVEAIVDCYLDTAGPPWLQVRHQQSHMYIYTCTHLITECYSHIDQQVDIPVNLANQIVDLTKEYLLGRNNPSHSVFVRESELLQDAQDFIFQELVPFWASFCNKNGYDVRTASRSSKPSG